MSQSSVVIVDGARTPIGGFNGIFSELSAIELGITSVREAVRRSGASNQEIDEVIFGCVLPAGLAQAPARQVAIGSELSLSTCCTTVNKMCGSGMKAVLVAHDQIKAGSSDIVVAGGMESMTRAPYLLTGARKGMHFGHGKMFDHMLLDGLEDAYTGKLMGSFAQNIADDYGFTREQMDTYAIESLARANSAIEQGYFLAEIAGVNLKKQEDCPPVLNDEQPGKANVKRIPELKPAFAKNGTITAANSSSISDGAAALVLMEESKAADRNSVPMARIISHASHALHPSEFSVAPIGAIEKVLVKSEWSLEDVDLFEINEAFAVVTMLAIQELGLQKDKVNIHGGACALGHPVGATGARIIVSLMYALKRLNRKRGIACLCIGGGEACAIAIEMI